MRRFLSCVVAVVIAGSAALFAQKATTAADLDKAMKKLGPASGAMNKAIKSLAWAEAKTQATLVEGALVDAHNFWVVKKQPEAVKMSNEAIAKAKAVKAALNRPTPDSAAVTAAAREFATTCLGCHKAFREQDANQQFVLKAGI